MKKGFRVGLTLILAVAMLGSCLSALAEEAPAKATMPPAVVTGTVEGVVVDVESNDIIINMANGNTIGFMMNYLTHTEAGIGDKVSIEYAGDVADRPEAVTITIIEKAAVLNVSGTVLSHDAKSVFVEISSQHAFGFTIDKDTKITGEAENIVNGDTVTVTYSGDLHTEATALTIEITKAVKERTEKKQDNPTNKSLDGYVQKLSNSAITIHTGKGKTYSFQINGNTKVTGSYDLETGARVVVTYDGYASKKPAAKIIKVIAPPDPTPTPKPVKNKTTKANVESFHGIFLSLNNGMVFNCTYATYSGDSDGEVGDLAKVTYYVGDDGVYYATHVNFTFVYLNPAPAPEPDPLIETAPGPVLGGTVN